MCVCVCMFVIMYICVYVWVCIGAHVDILSVPSGLHASTSVWQALQYGEHVIDPTISLGPTVSFTVCNGREVGTIIVLSLYLR